MPNALSLSGGVVPLLDDAARLAALLEVELALSAVAAEVGTTGEADADGVERAVAAVYGIDPAELGRDPGGPVDPLVRRLRAAARRIQPGAERAVHPGACGQDVLDTALVLLVRRAGARIVTELRAAADAAADLAARHRSTPAAHPSGPTTVGLLAAGWCAGLDRARVRLAAVLDALPVQYGGPAGTLAAAHPHGPAVADALAARLGLAAQGVPWHGERTRIGELAGALGVAAGACATTAADVARWSAAGEVSPGPGPGAATAVLRETPEPEAGALDADAGSGADTEPGAVAEAGADRDPGADADPGVDAGPDAGPAARTAPELVAAVLAAGAEPDPGPAGVIGAPGPPGGTTRASSRIPAGTEWEALVELVRVTAGAAARLRACLSGLRVHPTGASGDTGHAPELVDRVLAGRPR